MKYQQFLLLLCSSLLGPSAAFGEGDKPATRPKAPAITVPAAKTPGLKAAPTPAPEPTVVGEEAPAGPSELASSAAPVHLLHNTTLSPAMAVLAENTLFYTEWVGKPGCAGAGLYSYSLSQHTEKPVGELACVSHLDADGAQVYVESTEGDAGKTQIYRVEGENLINLIDKNVESLIGAALNFHLAEQGLPDGGQLAQRRMRVRDGKLYILMQFKPASDGTENKAAPTLTTLLDVVPLPDGKMEMTNSIFSMPSLTEVSDFDTDGKGNLYLLTSSPQGNKIMIAQLSGESATEVTTIGGMPRRMIAWTSVEATEWAIRQPLFLTGTGFGFGIFDATPRRDEQRNISFYESATKKFYRAAFSAPNITGMVPHRGGMLVTQKVGTGGDVNWYGSGNPFPQEWLTNPTSAINSRSK